MPFYDESQYTGTLWVHRKVGDAPQQALPVLDHFAVPMTATGPEMLFLLAEPDQSLSVITHHRVERCAGGECQVEGCERRAAARGRGKAGG